MAVVVRTALLRRRVLLERQVTVALVDEAAREPEVARVQRQPVWLEAPVRMAVVVVAVMVQGLLQERPVALARHMLNLPTAPR